MAQLSSSERARRAAIISCFSLCNYTRFLLFFFSFSTGLIFWCEQLLQEPSNPNHDWRSKSSTPRFRTSCTFAACLTAGVFQELDKHSKSRIFISLVPRIPARRRSAALSSRSTSLPRNLPAAPRGARLSSTGERRWPPRWL